MGVFGGIAPVKAGTHAPLPADLGKLKLPDGREVDAVSGGELTRTLLACGVPGVTHEQGRQKNAEAYRAFIEQLREAAAARAVTELLARQEGS